MADKDDVKLQDLRNLLDLVEHPGWQLICRLIDGRAEEHYRDMRNADAEHKLILATANYMALRDLHLLPEQIAKVLKQQVDFSKNVK